MKISREQYFLNRRRIRNVMEYLDRHLDDDGIRLDTLADVANLSRFHFQRLYLSKVNESPMATVRRLRLKRARQMLLDGVAPSITHLAVHSGYGSVAAFSRAFSRAFNCAPTEVAAVRPGLSGGILQLSNPPALAFEIVQRPAVPVAYHPFTGRAADVFPAGDDFCWVMAPNQLRWRHWSVHPDGWVDPAIHPDTWVRMWHCAPLASVSPRLAGVEQGYLPPGLYARFVFVGKEQIDIPRLMGLVAAEGAWEVIPGPMLRHFPDLPHYTPISERITHLFLSVARR